MWHFSHRIIAVVDTIQDLSLMETFCICKSTKNLSNHSEDPLTLCPIGRYEGCGIFMYRLIVIVTTFREDSLVDLVHRTMDMWCSKITKTFDIFSTLFPASQQGNRHPQVDKSSAHACAHQFKRYRLSAPFGLSTSLDRRVYAFFKFFAAPVMLMKYFETRSRVKKGYQENEYSFIWIPLTTRENDNTYTINRF